MRDDYHDLASTHLSVMECSAWEVNKELLRVLSSWRWLSPLCLPTVSHPIIQLGINIKFSLSLFAHSIILVRPKAIHAVRERIFWLGLQLNYETNITLTVKQIWHHHIKYERVANNTLMISSAPGYLIDI